MLGEAFEELRVTFLEEIYVKDDIASWNKIFFAMEQAYWKYMDEYRNLDFYLPRYTLGQFAKEMFKIHEPLVAYASRALELTEQFVNYKRTIPTCGAIILNPGMTKVLLIRGWGRKARWGFPKGKVNEGETDLQAAIREVEEEIGFDISHNVEKHGALYNVYDGKRVVNFFVTRVNESTHFRTRTIKEISSIRWVNISDLPDSPEDSLTMRRCELQKPGRARERETQVVFFAQYGLALYTKDIRSFVKNRLKVLRRGNQYSDSRGVVPTRRWSRDEKTGSSSDRQWRPS